MKFIRKNIKIISIIVVLLFIVLLVILKIYLKSNFNVEEEVVIEESEILIEDQETSEDEKDVIKNVFVDIKGAVKKAGVYEIEENKKVIDVVNKAGGLTDDADTSMINLAKQVKNEMVIIIYTKEEVRKYSTKEEIIKVIDKECVCPEIKNDACINNKDNTIKEENNKVNDGDISSNKKINLNSATLEELLTLTGIGESKAKSIIEYREKNGGFKNIEEIKNVSGIGDSLYEKIKNNITI